MLQPTEIERRDIVKAIFGQDLVENAGNDRFQCYFANYCSIVCPSASGDAVIELDTPALRSHNDVLHCVKILCQNPRLSFHEFIAATVKSNTAEASPREQVHIARITTEVAFAINCSLRDYYSRLSVDIPPHLVEWKGDVTFLNFIENAFNSISQPDKKLDHTQPPIKRSSIKAWKLTKRYGIKIRGTNNLLEHLALDVETMTLKVFHQVSFIRGHLKKSKDEPFDLNLEESLKKGTLPPRLLFETLLTFHDVLYPITSIRDKRSLSALKTMIKKHGFDPEGRDIDFIRAMPANMTFGYWGSRLSTLQEVVKKPPPANAIVSWFERHSSERNALTVAILGLFLSVLFGLLSFIVGLLQLILAWVAYRHPPPSN